MSELSIKELAASYVKSIPEGMFYLTPSELRALMQEEDVFILDNRDKEDFEKGHIPGAVNIELRQVFDPVELRKIPTERKVVVCCWVGHTASQLVPLLRMVGIDAIGLKYGMGCARDPKEERKGWAELGYEVGQS